jgi:predicted KAP-like P-loop ATPase
MNEMADGGNIGFFVSIGTAIGSVVMFLKFWTWLTDRIAAAKDTADRAALKAESAQQEAAEAKNDLSNFREALDEMTRNLQDRMERVRREDGDALGAIRQHVTDLAMFMRDNFVRNSEFAAAMTKIEAGQLRTETKIDQISERIRG